MLSHRSQVAQMRHLAVPALDAYPLADPELRFIAHGENTTFRVDATAPGGRKRFLLPGDLRRRFDGVAARMKLVMTDLGSAADSVGLIHADLHPGNALFWHDDVRVIDFDDCGFGYWLYDIAVALWELRHRHDYEQFRDALTQGYTQHRPLPGDLALLDDFIATRDVAFGLWFTGTAQANHAFRAELDEVLRNIGHSLDTLTGS